MAAAGALSIADDQEVASPERSTELTTRAQRLITTADESGSAHVAVISHWYWMRRFAGDTGIVNAPVTVNALSASGTPPARA